MKTYTLFIFACLLLIISSVGTFFASAQDDEAVIPGEQEHDDHYGFTNIAVKHPDHNEAPPSEDADSGMNEHEAMRCHVCRHAIKPALVKHIQENAGKKDPKDLIEEELRTLAHKHIYELESRSVILRDIPEEKHFSDMERDENIHHFIEHLLWDEHLACQLYALVDVYIQQPRRRKWFSRLVDQVICPCHNGKEIMRLDHDIDKYLMNHIAATQQAAKRYKLLHEAWSDEPRAQENPKPNVIGNPEDDRKGEGAQHIGDIWVDRDGHLDRHAQEAHQHNSRDADGWEPPQHMNADMGFDGMMGGHH